MGVDGEGQGIATARGHRVGIIQSTNLLTFPPSLYSNFAWSVRMCHSPAFHSWLPTRSADEITYKHRLSTRLRSARARRTNTFLSCQATACWIPLQKTSLAGIRYIATTLSELLKSGEDNIGSEHEEMGSLMSAPQSRRKARFPLGGRIHYYYG